MSDKPIIDVEAVIEAIARGVDSARESGVNCGYPLTVTVNGITYPFERDILPKQ